MSWMFCGRMPTSPELRMVFVWEADVYLFQVPPSTEMRPLIAAYAFQSADSVVVV